MQLYELEDVLGVDIYSIMIVVETDVIVASEILQLIDDDCEGESTIVIIAHSDDDVVVEVEAVDIDVVIMLDVVAVDVDVNEMMVLLKLID